MIFLYLIGLIAYIFTWVLSLLPDGDFLALPDVAYEAVNTVGSWFGWLIGIFGPNIKTAILTALPIYLGIQLAVFLWHILRHWKVPLVSRFIQGK